MGLAEQPEKGQVAASDVGVETQNLASDRSQETSEEGRRMSRSRVPMRRIREVLRLKHDGGMSSRQVSAATGLPRTTVRDYPAQARASGVTWPLPEDLDDAELERRLFGLGMQRPAAAVETGRTVPEWEEVYGELRRPTVTLQLLRED